MAISDPWSQSAGDFKVALNLKEGLGEKNRSEKKKKKRRKERKTLRVRVIFKWDSV